MNKINHIYGVVIARSNHSRILEKAEKLKEYFGYKNFKSGSDSQILVFYDKQYGISDHIVSLSVINDLGDYDETGISGELLSGNFVEQMDWDSLLSMSCINEKWFACLSDYWGIMTHYYCQTQEFFLCSNNIFLVSHLMEARISTASFYDFLFFTRPRKDRTWFEGIKRLYPGQQLAYDMGSHSVKLSSATDLSGLLKDSESDLFRNLDDFFLKAKQKIDNQPVVISLSAGSDSRTLLACLRHYGFEVKARSWGGDNFLETKKIQKLVNKFNIPWDLIPSDDYLTDFLENYKRGILVSNGLLPALHHQFYYDRLDPFCTVFEGYFGSEFVKGELSDGMFTRLYYDVIHGHSVKDTVERYVNEFSAEFKNAFAGYIRDEYGEEFDGIQSDTGLEKFQSYLLEFLPSKRFAGIFLSALAHGIDPYYPYISPGILAAVFNGGYGIKRNVSVRDDFSGSIKSIEVQSKIVKRMDNEIFRSLLDRNIRFADALKPRFIGGLIRKYHILRQKVSYPGQLSKSQVDHSPISTILEKFISDSQYSPLTSRLDGGVTGLKNRIILGANFSLFLIQEISDDLPLSYLNVKNEHPNP